MPSISEFVEAIKILKRNGDYEAARFILTQTVNWLDTHIPPGEVIPPWYYEQLSIVLKKLGDKAAAKTMRMRADEIIVANFIHYPGASVITKKVYDAARRLLPYRPELLREANLLTPDGKIVVRTPTQFILEKEKREKRGY